MKHFHNHTPDYLSSLEKITQHKRRAAQHLQFCTRAALVTPCWLWLLGGSRDYLYSHCSTLCSQWVTLLEQTAAFSALSNKGHRCCRVASEAERAAGEDVQNKAAPRDRKIPQIKRPDHRATIKFLFARSCCTDFFYYVTDKFSSLCEDLHIS